MKLSGLLSLQFYTTIRLQRLNYLILVHTDSAQLIWQLFQIFQRAPKAQGVLVYEKKQLNEQSLDIH